MQNWTVSMLRQEVAKRSNMGTHSINLICAGKVLKDGDGSEKLCQLGIKNNSKILVTRVSLEEGNSLKEELMADEERNRRLARVKAAVTALSKRHADGSLPIEDFNLELEDQSGQKLHFSETDQHMEAFSLCNPKSIELVDNIPILQIDMVWCYFMLRDIAWLSVAGVRLEKAREGLEHAHGKDSSRFRLLQAGRSSELALYLRLELLEGVVAYHSGQFDKCRRFFDLCTSKILPLQVSDEALSTVMSMGFKEQDAKKALRMSNQDVESAINFLVEEKDKKAKKREDDIRRRNEIREQQRYGVTPLRKAVDLQRLKELISVGFDKELAAEALRRNENDTQKALDDLTNPETNTAIQRDIESKKRKRQRQKDEATIEQLVSMGFERSRVVEAVQAGGSMDQAMQQLLTQSSSNPTDPANSTISPGLIPTNNEGMGEDHMSNDSDVGGPSTSKIEQRDAEMEDEIADEIAKGDALTDYDIEVTKEGEAINEYLALLDSVGSSEKASSQ
ncbi:hypothetical protein GH714_014452 [Hevea brasiliensis]|uniref:UBA domain-containing protein n=1 Tax=Hevea brasiliensis TaxID=3981 RepID=A0A6A6MCC2_HEVBR|nr:hypothetical protein GH714_014452 [Hevea brasiliensis]